MSAPATYRIGDRRDAWVPSRHIQGMWWVPGVVKQPNRSRFLAVDTIEFDVDRPEMAGR